MKYTVAILLMGLAGCASQTSLPPANENFKSLKLILIEFAIQERHSIDREKRAILMDTRGINDMLSVESVRETYQNGWNEYATTIREGTLPLAKNLSQSQREELLHYVAKNRRLLGTAEINNEK